MLGLLASNCDIVTPMHYIYELNLLRHQLLAVLFILYKLLSTIMCEQRHDVTLRTKESFQRFLCEELHLYAIKVFMDAFVSKLHVDVYNKMFTRIVFNYCSINCGQEHLGSAGRL